MWIQETDQIIADAMKSGALVYSAIVTVKDMAKIVKK
jgi:hypothetical protein